MWLAIRRNQLGVLRSLQSPRSLSREYITWHLTGAWFTSVLNAIRAEGTPLQIDMCSLLFTSPVCVFSETFVIGLGYAFLCWCFGVAAQVVYGFPLSDFNAVSITIQGWMLPPWSRWIGRKIGVLVNDGSHETTHHEFTSFISSNLAKK